MNGARFFFLLVAALSVIGCGGESYPADPSGGAGPVGKLECYGDPDRMGVVCKTADELWDCTTMPNGEVKCTKIGYAPPTGSGSWSCKLSGGSLICTAPAGTVPGGSSGSSGGTSGGTGGSGTVSVGNSAWTCTTNGTTVTCTYEGSSTPPGGSGWTCTVNEFGISCTGQPGSGGTGGTGTGGTGTGTGTGGTGTGTGGTGPGTSTPGTGTNPGTGTGTGGSTTVPGTQFLCSYALVVYTYGGKTYVLKIGNGTISCSGQDTTSSDANFNYTCNGHTYDNDNFVMHMDGGNLTPSPNCSALFLITARSITVTSPGVVIIYGVVHNGSFPNHFGTLCPVPGGTQKLDFPPICSN